MKFRGHETFYIRKGWLSKGLKNVLINPGVFMGKADNPTDVLGIGQNMVKSLRYWLQVVGLTRENKSGERRQDLTDFGKLVYTYDQYIEEVGTLWLLHYHLTKNECEATAWYFFFNEFKLMEFTKDDFIRQISAYLKMKNEEVSERSIEDDYTCIINTYLPKSKSSQDKVQPENNIECPLSELGLIDIVNKKEKSYRKVMPQRGDIPNLIALAVIVAQAGDRKEIKISELQNGKGGLGKIFNLDMIALTSLLYEIELMNYIKVIRTAGLDVVKINTNLNFIECVEQYYKSLNR